MGKTTLLNHIAEKKLAIPPNIDVLLCEQEVKADDTPAFDAVLSADKKRLQLLKEEKKLLAEGESGDDSNSERLKQVQLCVTVKTELKITICDTGHFLAISFPCLLYLYNYSDCKN